MATDQFNAFIQDIHEAQPAAVAKRYGFNKVLGPDQYKEYFKHVVDQVTNKTCPPSRRFEAPL
jgi:hypothetical protein